MTDISKGSSGSAELLLGSEDIGRGALEGVVYVVASYPGYPSTEIHDETIQENPGLRPTLSTA